MDRYRITYTDRHDRGCPDFRLTLRAHSRDHAEERFVENGDDGWEIVKIERLDDGARALSGRRHARRSST